MKQAVYGHKATKTDNFMDNHHFNSLPTNVQIIRTTGQMTTHIVYKNKMCLMCVCMLENQVLIY